MELATIWLSATHFSLTFLTIPIECSNCKTPEASFYPYAVSSKANGNKIASIRDIDHTIVRRIYII